MNTLPPQQLLAQLNWRYATKQFDPARKIAPATWAALEEALVLTPSSFGLQPWKFIVVADPAVREKLVAVSWNQRQIADASHLVVFAVKTPFGEKDIDHLLARIAELRGVPAASLAPYREMMAGSLLRGLDEAARAQWAIRQVYIALGNFLTCAALMGVDACPMEGIEPAKYNEILGLPQQGLSAVVVATAGYRSSADKYAALTKVRYPRSEVVLTI